jgi:hypothetical protein
MKERIKYFAKLSSTAALSWIKINLLGAFSTAVVFIIAIIFLAKNIDAGHSAHVSAIPFLIMVFMNKPLSSILFLGIFFSPFLIFALGNKYIISKLINKVIKDKSEVYLEPFIDKMFSKFQEKQPDLIKKGADASLVKLKLINQIKAESENKWLKRIITFGLKKIKLDEVDFSNQKVSFSEIIKTKLITALHEFSEPSKKGIFIILGLQWLFLLIIVLSPI